MQPHRMQNERKTLSNGPFRNLLRRRSVRVCACLAFVAAFPCVAQDGHPTGGALRSDKVDLPTPINQPPDPNFQMEGQAQTTKQSKFEAANEERKRQIAGDSTKLLTLAI